MKRFLKNSTIAHSPLRAVLLAGLVIVLFHSSNAIAGEKKSQPSLKKVQTGKASFYCKPFHGRRTALGTIYNRTHLVAAHPSLPFRTLVRVTNLGNNRQVEVRIVDRGPTKAQRKRGIIIDLSRAAAEKLRMVRQGRARVRLEVLKWGQLKRPGPRHSLRPLA
jgi:rare lipoprotein A